MWTSKPRTSARRSVGWPARWPTGRRNQARTIKPGQGPGVSVRVGIVVFDGVEELDAVGVYEVLAKAKQIHPQLDLTVRFRAMKELVTGALGMKFLAHEVHHELSDLDLVIVPGGAGRTEVIQDHEFLKRLSTSERRSRLPVCARAR